ncbi:MAG: hypothetical protein ACFFG0_24690 [Candidatus Thorarchaeota archaeon]
MALKNRIKIWPFWDDISPSLIPYYDGTINFNKPIFIDFSEVKNCSSSGASIIVTKLIKIISKHTDKLWKIHFGENLYFEKLFTEIGALNILENHFLNKDLFWERIEFDPIIVEEEANNIRRISLPIFTLKYNRENKRESVENFINWLIQNFYNYCKNSSLRFDVFAKMLKEIAKNSCDHTDSDSFFGIDLITQKDKLDYLVFTFTDLGIGIHETVKRYKEKIGEDWSKKGIVDSYHFAFQPGNSTGNEMNKGIGMSMIHECTNILDLNLCIFDANSVGIVPPEITHSIIRDNFFNTGTSVGFNYFGKIYFKEK